MNASLDNGEDESKALLEWTKLQERGRSAIRIQHKDWLKKYGKLPVAGRVIRMLLMNWPSRSLVSRGKVWLKLHPEHDFAPGVLAGMLHVDPFRLWRAHAARYLHEAESKYFKKNDASKDYKNAIAHLIRELLRSHSRSSLTKDIERFISAYPRCSVWQDLFPIPGLETEIARVEQLTVLWLRLNVDTQELGLPASVLPLILPVRPVFHWCFEWIKNGGRNSRDMPRMLDSLLRKLPVCCPELLGPVVKYSRQWVKTNPRHYQAGKILGSMVLATRSASDVKLAVQWLKAHLDVETAKWVVADLLELAHQTSTRPDPYIALQAKVLLRNEETRRSFTHLVFVAVSACPDEETIRWAKEHVKQTHSCGILVGLLESAPDNESNEMAMNSYNEWINTPLEPEMLRAILKADRNNRKARRRAYHWLKLHRKHEYYKPISLLLHRE